MLGAYQTTTCPGAQSGQLSVLSTHVPLEQQLEASHFDAHGTETLQMFPLPVIVHHEKQLRSPFVKEAWQCGECHVRVCAHRGCE